MCTINQDNMYGSWDVKCNIICLSSWDYPFTPITARKMKTTKMKTPLEISSFYTSVPKFMIIRYTVPEMWRVTDVIVIFILDYTFPFYPSTVQKMKISKQWKKDHDHMLYCSWDMVRVGCNCYFSIYAIFCPLIPLTTQKMKISK